MGSEEKKQSMKLALQSAKGAHLAIVPKKERRERRVKREWGVSILSGSWVGPTHPLLTENSEPLLRKLLSCVPENRAKQSHYGKLPYYHLRGYLLPKPLHRL